MEMTLGRFGDRRLEKGGPFCSPDWSMSAGGRFGFASWAGRGPAKSG
jgi:hypothetical protein